MCPCCATFILIVHCALCIVALYFALCISCFIIMDMGNLVLVCSVLCPEAGAGCRVAMPEEVEWGSEDGDGDCKLKLHTVHSKLSGAETPDRLSQILFILFCGL